MSRGFNYRTAKYAGVCEYCGQLVPAGLGLVRRDRYRRSIVRHHPTQQVGWPIPSQIGGCPPSPPEPEEGAEPIGDALAGHLTVDVAREWLYRRYFRNRPPAAWVDPERKHERERMDVEVLRLAALHPIELYAHTHNVEALIKIADFQDWS